MSNQPIYAPDPYGQQRQVHVPPITATVWLTILFGVFGAFSANSKTKYVRGQGIDTNKYWKAFWVTFGAGFAAWIFFWVIIAAAGSAASSNYEDQVNQALSEIPTYNANIGQDVTSEVTLAPASCDSLATTVTGVVAVDNTTDQAQSVYVTINVTDISSGLPAGTFHVWNNTPIAPRTTWTYQYTSSNFALTSDSCGVDVESATLQ